MPGPVLVGYDGSEPSDRALDHAVALAKSHDTSIILVHVLEWSPYSFLTQEELAERHARRKDEMARAESAVLKPALERVSASGLKIEPVIQYGHSAEILARVAKEKGADQIIVGRDGSGGLAARLFGSTAATLIQIATIPCTIVP
ncbi:Nucleotide-binding universal stress protein, UspA family [Roseivivax lentus]|uniref:Nucleotide-binding universal stress protein, UspA family n=1 Tax=Roseivivax lentus TaxID=633194 RepID=A0A1N7MET4_9RHOB|nr:universal stress protein [Roseivivax lentus]SIS84614.1 Nucleotide-binding universal stress protein, UspA family [Roseivivax lentus]